MKVQRTGAHPSAYSHVHTPSVFSDLSATPAPSAYGYSPYLFHGYVPSTFQSNMIPFGQSPFLQQPQLRQSPHIANFPYKESEEDEPEED